MLHTPTGSNMRLEPLVEQFIRDGVVFVGVVGKDCSRIEEFIDAICVGDGESISDILTSSHPDCTLDEAVVFARSLTGEFAGEVQVVEL